MIEETLLVLSFVTGAALLSMASWMIFPPAGIIVGGAFLLAIPFLYVRGRARDGGEA